MTEHITFLNDIEAHAANEGRLRLIVRPVRPQPPEDFEGPYQDSNGVWIICDNRPPDILNTYKLHGSLGVPGDVLLGKEAFSFLWPENCDDGRIYDEEHRELGRPIRDDECAVEYRANTRNTRPGDWPDDEPDGPRWRPASRMPRWAVRWRRVVERHGIMRIWEISEEEALSTGVRPRNGLSWQQVGFTPSEAFRNYWDCRWPKYPFAANPWAWFAWVRKEE